MCTTSTLLILMSANLRLYTARVMPCSSDVGLKDLQRGNGISKLFSAAFWLKDPLQIL